MSRPFLTVLIVGIALAAVGSAYAADRSNPRRFQRGSFSQYVIKTRDGQRVVSQTYNGYDRRLPPPAFLYYGYPHSGDMTGIGPLDRK